jgi:hypothetical protein
MEMPSSAASVVIWSCLRVISTVVAVQLLGEVRMAGRVWVGR